MSQEADGYFPDTYTVTSHGGQPPLEPIVSVDPSPVDLSREGPFDTYCEPGDTGGHPLIST